MRRAPLTTTHPHGYVLARADRALGLVRISKNASTESKVRLLCEEWIAFGAFPGPSVAFIREPVSRFLSSIPETVLRMTEPQLAEVDRKDRVEVPEDVYRELLGNAASPIEQLAQLFLELVEYGFFDAHHEPQVSFLADRNMALRIDPWLYPTQAFERSIAQITARFGITTAPAGQRSNKGGAKPVAGRNGVVDLVRRISRTGVHARVRNAGLLGARYRGDSGPISLRDLNAFANRFAAEMKSAELPGSYRERILALYGADAALWRLVSDREGDARASEVWPF